MSSWACVEVDTGLWAIFRVAMPSGATVECGSNDGVDCVWFTTGSCNQSSYTQSIACSAIKQVSQLPLANSTALCSTLLGKVTAATAATASPTPNATLEAVGYIVLTVGALFLLGSLVYVMRYRKRNVAFEHNHFMWAETFKSAVMVAMSPMVKTSNMTPVDVILTDEGRDAQASVMDAFSLWKLEHNLLKLTSMLSESDDKQVWRGLYDDEVVAVKKLRLHATTGPSWVKFVNEIQLMMRCDRFDSPHIIAMYGVVWSIPDDNNIQLVFEFMDGGNLRDYLAQTRHRSVEMWGEKLRYAMHLIEALVCLHDSSVIHRDVKSKHVLLNSAGDAKLTDFGWSRELDLQVLMTQGAGSFRWTAPEILEGNQYTVAADIYSFGMVCYELDAHQIPYATSMRSNTVKPLNEFEIIHGVRAQQLKVEFEIGCPVADLASRCLQFDPANRPTAAQVLQWLLELQ